jgi:hypothetical protein
MDLEDDIEFHVPDINDRDPFFTPWPTVGPDNNVLAVLFAFLRFRVPDVLWRLTQDPQRAMYTSGTPRLADAIDRVNQINDLVAPYLPYPNEAKFKERADFRHFDRIWQKQWSESAVETQPFLQIKFFIRDFRDAGYAIEDIPVREMDLWNRLLELVDLPAASRPVQSAVCSVCNIGSSATFTLQQCPCSGTRIYCGTSCQAKDWTPDHWVLH